MPFPFLEKARFGNRMKKTVKPYPQEEKNLNEPTKGKKRVSGFEVESGQLAIALLALGILAAIFMWFRKGAKAVVLNSKKVRLAQLRKEESELSETLKYLKWKKDRLEQQYEKAYRLLRFLVFLVWVLLQVVVAIIFCEFKATEILGFLTDLNAFALIIIGFIHYVKFGTLTNYLRYLVRFRTWIKNYVFRNHLNIEQDIFDCDQHRRTIISRQQSLREEIEELDKEFNFHGN